MAEGPKHEKSESKSMETKEHRMGMEKADESKRKKGRKSGRAMKRGK